MKLNMFWLWPAQCWTICCMNSHSDRSHSCRYCCCCLILQSRQVTVCSRFNWYQLFKYAFEINIKVSVWSMSWERGRHWQRTANINTTTTCRFIISYDNENVYIKKQKFIFFRNMHIFYYKNDVRWHSSNWFTADRFRCISSANHGRLWWEWMVFYLGFVAF